jgi:hypothetical protein
MGTRVVGATSMTMPSPAISKPRTLVCFNPRIRASIVVMRTADGTSLLAWQLARYPLFRARFLHAPGDALALTIPGRFDCVVTLATASELPSNLGESRKKQIVRNRDEPNGGERDLVSSNQ